jgi:hypothetical protein
MIHEFKPIFRHRLNADNAFDSICSSCLQTVSTERNEADLFQHEQDHECDPMQLFEASYFTDWSRSIAI